MREHARGRIGEREREWQKERDREGLRESAIERERWKERAGVRKKRESEGRQSRGDRAGNRESVGARVRT